MAWKKSAALAVIAGAALCIGVAVGMTGDSKPAPVPETPPVAETPVETPPAAEIPPASEPVQNTQADIQTEAAVEVVMGPEVERYDFSQPAPEREAVEKDYFADAAFVGDSRTDGFMIYSGVGCGTNLTSNGLSIFKLESKKALKIGGEKYTLLEALEREQYGKVYLCLGVNELGVYDDEGFYQSYLSAIDAIRACQPNAVIYIQGLIPLNEEDVKATNGPDYLKNDHLRVYNELMFKAAQEKQVVFLDLYTAFADENGALPAGASRDGVHLKKDYCQQWLAYLQSHTVDPAALGMTVEETESEETLPA